MIRSGIDFFNLLNPPPRQENAENPNSGQQPVTEREERPPTPPTPKQKRKADPESVTPQLGSQPDPSHNTAGGMPSLNLNGQ